MSRFIVRRMQKRCIPEMVSVIAPFATAYYTFKGERQERSAHCGGKPLSVKGSSVSDILSCMKVLLLFIGGAILLMMVNAFLGGNPLG